MSENAVVYVAWNMSHLSGFVELAERSLRSLKKHTPDVTSYLFTNKNPEYAEELNPFDHIEIIKVMETNPRTKTGGLLKSTEIVKEHRALYLDADTLVVGDISGMFEVLDYADIAAVHAPFGKGSRMKGDAFPVFNSGVILYSPRDVQSLFLEWHKNVESEDADQFVFSELLHKRVYNVVALSNEYNVRTGWPVVLSKEAKILHDRHNTGNAAVVINAKPDKRRVWSPKKGMLYS